MSLNALALEDPRTPDEALRTCFLCGKAVIQSRCMWFGTAPEEFDGVLVKNLAPELPCHNNCVAERTPLAVATAYHRAIGDLLNVARRHLPQHIATA